MKKLIMAVIIMVLVVTTSKLPSENPEIAGWEDYPITPHSIEQTQMEVAGWEDYPITPHSIQV